MKKIIMVIVLMMVVSVCLAGESDIKLANRTALIEQMKADNGLKDLVKTSGDITNAKALAIMQALPDAVMAWIDAKLSYDKVVKKTDAESGVVTYWRKVRQLRWCKDDIQIDVAGQNTLKAELEATKTRLTSEYNKKISDIQSQIDAIPSAPEDTNGE